MYILKQELFCDADADISEGNGIKALRILREKGYGYKEIFFNK